MTRKNNSSNNRDLSVLSNFPFLRSITEDDIEESLFNNVTDVGYNVRYVKWNDDSVITVSEHDAGDLIFHKMFCAGDCEDGLYYIIETSNDYDHEDLFNEEFALCAKKVNFDVSTNDIYDIIRISRMRVIPVSSAVKVVVDSDDNCIITSDIIATETYIFTDCPVDITSEEYRQHDVLTYAWTWVKNGKLCNQNYYCASEYDRDCRISIRLYGKIDPERVSIYKPQLGHTGRSLIKQGFENVLEDENYVPNTYIYDPYRMAQTALDVLTTLINPLSSLDMPKERLLDIIVTVANRVERNDERYINISQVIWSDNFVIIKFNDVYDTNDITVSRNGSIISPYILAYITDDGTFAQIYSHEVGATYVGWLPELFELASREFQIMHY